MTLHADTLARHQWNSAHRLAHTLPDEAEVYPTHGFGSFCSATQAEGLSSTIGHEKTLNPVLTKAEDDYVDELIAGLVAYPAYYAHMGPANAAGPGSIDLTQPEEADPDELRRCIDAGEWVVDLENPQTDAHAHSCAGEGTIDRVFRLELAADLPPGAALEIVSKAAVGLAARGAAATAMRTTGGTSAGCAIPSSAASAICSLSLSNAVSRR